MTVFCFRGYRFNKGFTLIELMVAMLLGALFLSGLLQIFNAAKQTYRVQENLAHLQENGRLAMDFISQDVRMAGYWGCSRAAPKTTGLEKTDIFFYQFQKALEGFEAKSPVPLPKNVGLSSSATAWQPNVPIVDGAFDLTAPDHLLQGSDVLTLRKTEPTGVAVNDAALPASPLRVKASADELKRAGFKEESVGIVSDCKTAEAFEVTAVADNLMSHAIASIVSVDKKTVKPGNNTANLSLGLIGAKVHAVNTVSYYVAVNGNGEKVLYRRKNATPAEELVDGVEEMQIIYGVDNDADSQPNYYVTADKIAQNWDKVVSVRVSLLLATLENVAAQPVPYVFNSPNNTPTLPSNDKDDKPDTKIRRVFTSTIAIRNRLAQNNSNL